MKEQIGRTIKLARKAHKIKQGNLAERVGISQTYLSQIEAGKVNVSIDILAKICKILDIHSIKIK